MNKYINALSRSFTSREARFNYLAILGFYNRLSDKKFLQNKYRSIFNSDLDLENPVTFNEKLQWLKLYDRNPIYTMMVDKYLVREYISTKIGKKYLIPLIGVWDSPDEIDFDTLPSQFVIKCNHNSGRGMCICKDKQDLEIKKVKRALKKGLIQDYYLLGREWPYKNVPRKIIAEKYMVDESGVELKDYKIFNFNGQPKIIEVDFGRFVNHKRNLYTIDWKKIDLKLQYQNDLRMEIKKPQCLDEMLNLARILSESIPFVRTDFYIINNDIYFGEITFFHDGGFGRFEPEDWNRIMGGWISLPRL